MKGIGLRDALRGIRLAVRTERNLRIELCAGLYALGLGLYAELEPWGFCAVFLCCGAVLGLELANSALERLGDRLSREKDPYIGTAKDMAAGAVLCAALASLAVAAVLFGRPAVWEKLWRPQSLWFLTGGVPALCFVFWYGKNGKKDT